MSSSWTKALEVVLPNSKQTVFSHLFDMETKLDQNLEFSDLYYNETDTIIRNYAEKIQIKGEVKRIWYVPHFGVVHPNKSTKKLRVVFDAAPRSKGLSLNDQLLKGPYLLNHLLGNSMEFTLYPVAIKGDIKDMFLRVKVRDEDRDEQRFLWRVRDRDVDPDAYVMKSLICGAKSSLFSAIYIKDTNTKQYQSSVPEAASAIMNSSYVDDFSHSCESDEAAIKIINQASEINSKGGFHMHELVSH